MVLDKIQAKLFNISAKRTSKAVIRALNIRKGHNVADIGSGGGLYVKEFSRLVGKGEVYAVDRNKKYLDTIKNKNIRKVLVTGELSLPVKMDLIFMRSVYHHLENRLEYMKKLKKFLNKDGRIAIIDYLPGTGMFRPKGHSVAKKVIIKEMKDAGYELIESFDFLKDQTFGIFSMK